MTIDECFAKLDALGNDKDQSEQIFTQLKPQIDDYELIDETIFFLYLIFIKKNMNNERRFYHHKNHCLHNQHVKVATWEKPSRFVIVLLTS
jgi:hypothetical protein